MALRARSGRTALPRCFVAVRLSVSPFDPVGVVDEFPGVVDPGTPQEFDKIAVVAGEPDDLSLDGDSPSAGTREAVDDYWGLHFSRVRRGAAHSTPSSVSGLC